MLPTRDVPSGPLPLTLDRLAAFFAGRPGGADVQIVVAALHRTKARLLGRGESAPAIHRLMPRSWPECAAFASALLRGDRRFAEALFDRCLEQGHGLVEAEMHLIQPALYEIGRKWQDNQVTVAQEHMATAIANSSRLAVQTGPG